MTYLIIGIAVVCIILVILVVGYFVLYDGLPQYEFRHKVDCTFDPATRGADRVVEPWVNLETSLRRAKELNKPVFAYYHNGQVYYGNRVMPTCTPWSGNTYTQEMGSYILK